MVTCRIVNAFSSLFGYQRNVGYLIETHKFWDCPPQGEEE